MEISGGGARGAQCFPNFPGSLHHPFIILDLRSSTFIDAVEEKEFVISLDVVVVVASDDKRLIIVAKGGDENLSRDSPRDRIDSAYSPKRFSVPYDQGLPCRPHRSTVSRMSPMHWCHQKRREESNSRTNYEGR